MLVKHDLERGAMMEEEDGLSAYELLDEERRWADFARRVFNGGLIGGFGAGL